MCESKGVRCTGGQCPPSGGREAGCEDRREGRRGDWREVHRGVLSGLRERGASAMDRTGGPFRGVGLG